MKTSLQTLFQQRLRMAMERKGVNASSLARAVGVSHVAIGKYLDQDNPSMPAADVLHRMAECLGTAMDSFFKTGEKTAAAARRKPRPDPRPAS